MDFGAVRGEGKSVAAGHLRWEIIQSPLNQTKKAKARK